MTSHVSLRPIWQMRDIFPSTQVVILLISFHIGILHSLPIISNSFAMAEVYLISTLCPNPGKEEQVRATYNPHLISVEF